MYDLKRGGKIKSVGRARRATPEIEYHDDPQNREERREQEKWERRNTKSAPKQDRVSEGR